MTALNENILSRVRIEIDKNEKPNGLIANELHRAFLASGKDEIIIVNIGTDKIIADCYAPFIGSMLEDECLDIKVYGTLDKPIHALNIRKEIEIIYASHPNAFVIGVDASLGAVEDIGKTILRDKPIQAGKGVGKSLPSVGEYSILAVIENQNINIFSSSNVRLSFVRNLANNMAQEIILLNYLVGKKINKKVS